MPTILLTVPRDTSDSNWERADEEIKLALRAKGVMGGITIWPVMLVKVPGRLLLEYKSRQDPPVDKDILAQVLASAAEKVLGLQVEAMIIKLDPATTGIHITPKP